MDAPPALRRRDRFTLLAMAVLAFTILVIVSGDVVQATGSGAGCGESWPRCDGSLIPSIGDAKTAIEFTHRALTAVLGAGFAAMVLWTWTRRSPGQRHLQRSVAWATGFFVLEVVIGALLVRYGWVEDDASFGRVVADAVHLVNTFLLVGALVLVVHNARGGAAIRVDPTRRPDRLLLGGFAILLVVGITGAVNSLADTLYFADGVDVESTPIASILVAIRGVHPVVAIGGGLLLAVLVRPAAEVNPAARRLSGAIQVAVLGQFAIGLLNIALLTPLETQVLHLVTAHGVWVLLVALAASVMGEPAGVPHRDVMAS
jgi:heme A synthase